LIILGGESYYDNTASNAVVALPKAFAMHAIDTYNPVDNALFSLKLIVVIDLCKIEVQENDELNIACDIIVNKNNLNCKDSANIAWPIIEINNAARIVRRYPYMLGSDDSINGTKDATNALIDKIIEYPNGVTKPIVIKCAIIIVVAICEI
jgi:hypothetical protein